MHSTNELLDLVKQKHQIQSDYKLALFLGVSKQSMTHYRQNRTALSDLVAERVAEHLGLDPGYVAACMQAERSATEQSKSLWLSVAHRLQAGVAHVGVLMLTFAISLIATYSPNAEATALSPAGNYVNELYIVSNRISRFAAAIRRVFSAIFSRFLRTLHVQSTHANTAYLYAA